MRILFVCLGNICRSPLAEGVMAHLLSEQGLDMEHSVDSAGTAAYHSGEAADPRSRQVAAQHGITLSSRARAVHHRDFEDFDLILAMDNSNLNNLYRMARGTGGRRKSSSSGTTTPDTRDGKEVPDPYYGGPQGFQKVYEMVDRTCRNLIKSLS
jgi:protein-tyrosine phosphatase